VEQRTGQHPDHPVEGTVVATGASPVGFAGAPAAGTPGQPAVAGWQHGYWQAASTPGAPHRRRRRRLPLSLAGAGLVLLVGGGAGGYAIGHATADGTGTTAQTGELVPATGQFPGGAAGQLGTPPDAGGGFGGLLGQPDGTTDAGTAAGTTT
jgi:hypothetical protein